MYSTSTGLACFERRLASWAAFHASAPASGPIGALMLGPHANAIPHQQMAHFGSSLAASRKASIAPSWLNP